MKHRAILYLVLFGCRDVVTVRIAQAGHNHLRDLGSAQSRYAVSNDVPQSPTCHRGELPRHTCYCDAAYKRQLRGHNSRLPLEWELHLAQKGITCYSVQLQCLQRHLVDICMSLRLDYTKTFPVKGCVGLFCDSWGTTNRVWRNDRS